MHEHFQHRRHGRLAAAWNAHEGVKFRPIRQARAPFTVLKSRFRIEAAQDFEKATDGFQEGSAAVAHDKSIRPRADKQMHDDTSKCLESLEKVIEPEGGPSHRGPPEPRLMKSQGGP